VDYPLISVIVPVYNVEKYLIRCVRSIQAQTYPNLEIILVDDGSPDRSGAMCDELAAENNKIRVIHKRNGGLSSARNAGLDSMRGEYVAFVDSDDWIEPDMYECLYQAMVQEGAQIACCGIVLCDDEKVLSYMNPNLSDSETMSRKEALRSLTYNNRITNSANDKLYSREIFKELRFREGVVYEDAQIQPFCLEQAERITYTAKPFYHYYQSGTSILRSEFSPKRLDMIRWSEERIALYKEKYPDLLDHAYAAHAVLCTHIVYQARHSSECKEESARLIKTLRGILNRKTFSLLRMQDKVRCGTLYINYWLFIAVLNLFYRIKRK